MVKGTMGAVGLSDARQGHSAAARPFPGMLMTVHVREAESEMQVIDGTIAIDISLDEMEARAKIVNAELLSDVQAIRAALKETGVVYGVSEDGLRHLEQNNGQSTVVALGIRPGRGADGRIEYPFGKPPVGGKNERGGLVITNVRAGQRVAILHPPEEGTPGLTITGKTVPGKVGNKATIELGSNVKRDPNDLSAIIAQVDGNLVSLSEGGLAVQPTIVIPGDLDLGVGDIEFVGTLKVEGDIKGGVNVRVGRQLRVNGGIEDATIECEGEVIVEKGFIGHGDGRISAGGTVRVHHVRNQTVTSKGDVIIAGESVDAKIEAGGKLVGGTAVFIGGVIEADKDVDVKTLGSSENSQIRVRAGKRGKILHRLVTNDKEYKHAEQQLKKAKETVYKLSRAKIQGTLSDDQEVILTKTRGILTVLPENMTQLQHERATLMEELQHLSESCIVVHDTVHENVLIDINGTKFITDTALKQVMFVKEGYTIVPRDFE